MQKRIKGQIAGADGNKEEGLFFIAIVPPKPTQSQVTQLKAEVREKYGSKHALNSPPHITLHMPFKWKLSKLDLLEETLRRMSTNRHGFDVQLQGFNAFPPRVIYIDVTPNKELRSLQKQVATMARRQLGLDNADYKNRGFQPHMTIAFRDLKKARFEEAWRDFEKRTFDATFRVTSLTLFKNEDQRWNVYQEFPLEETPELKNL
ncbi:MAG: RNA 2',3'-cyclic phosphodiesterase [Cyclobacteriaceae bacterium]